MEATTYYENGRIKGSLLKSIALAAMLIDHAACMFGDYISMEAYQAMRLVGRMAFPIFCFLLVQGYLHTRSVKKYALRLAVFALASEIPFDLAFNDGMEIGSQNVFFTLLIGLLTIHAMHKWEAFAFLQLVAILAGCALAFILATDYSYLGVVQIAMFYNYRYLKGLRIASIVLVNALINGVFTSGPDDGLKEALAQALFSSSSLLFIEAYNGKRGRGWKYAFYLFYPVHLLALWLLKVLVDQGWGNVF